MKKEMLIIGLWVLAFLGAGTTIALTSINSTYKDKMPGLPRILLTQKLMPPYPLTLRSDTSDLPVIRHFLFQMDSLRLDSIRHRSYDSICHFRPGLIDSARTAEKLYNLLNTLK